MEKEAPVYVTCPFCKTAKRSDNEKTCRVCGLKFDELSEASNKEAKKRSLNRKPFESLEDEIIYTKIPPKDVDVPTAKTLTYLFGFFGAGNLYVGEFFKGFTMLLLAIAGIALELIYYTKKIEAILSIGTIVVLIPFIMWIVDAIMITNKSFKYPAKLKTNIDVDKFYESANAYKGKRK